MFRFGKIMAACALVAVAPLVRADTIATFSFAPKGTAFSAFLAPDSPFIGMEIVSARIYLDIKVKRGSNAANFFTDSVFPIDPFPGSENGLVLTGTDLGWSGSGTFHFFEETSRFNGVFVSTRFGGETAGDFKGAILDGSRIEFDYVPVAVPEPQAVYLILLGAAAVISWRRILRRS
jgi:hypothetical protein